jgi:hypothetical protein
MKADKFFGEAYANVEGEDLDLWFDIKGWRIDMNIGDYDSKEVDFCIPVRASTREPVEEVDAGFVELAHTAARYRDLFSLMMTTGRDDEAQRAWDSMSHAIEELMEALERKTQAPF